MKSDTIPLSVRVTTTELAVIQTEIRRGKVINTSDFVRQAIREKIAKIES